MPGIVPHSNSFFRQAQWYRWLHDYRTYEEVVAKLLSERADTETKIRAAYVAGFQARTRKYSGSEELYSHTTS